MARRRGAEGGTLLTIPIAHDFWNQQGPAAMMEMFFAIEHIGVVGGLLLGAILCQRCAEPIAIDEAIPAAPPA